VGLETAGKASGELVWRMPLHPRYADTIRSEVADVTNSVEGASPGAGLSAAFVGHFVDPAMPWAHVDMAGVMASTGKPLAPKGMSGYGVRLLEAFARDWRPARRD
ncbi:MAG TPA: leucyl aminopeptidase, partial [Novosphingobium sp.]|nr:leucyl aminopeptidase [Novosphingobium sp.]